jgi:RimJ/RimL family protein N-acetyltransferase
VLPGARGCGVAARALGAMGDWLFGEIGLHRLELLHATGNPASCRVALRAGHAAEGTRLRQALNADGWHDLHAHARLRA